MLEYDWLLGLHITSDLLPTSVLWVTDVLFLVMLLYAVRHFPFRRLMEEPSRQHVFFGAMVLLLMIWGIKAGITPGLGYHHLGAALFTLMFGWSPAIIGLTVVLLASILLPQSLDSIDLIGAGINGLLSVVIPVATSWSVLRLSERYLPDNFFTYIFVVAFFGAGLAVATSRLASMLVLGLLGSYPNAILVDESLQLLPLFMFPEMFITGMLISIFVVYKPDWVITFDDERYIKGK